MREGWMHQAASVCQRILGEIVLGGPGASEGEIARISEGLPKPVSKLERLILQGLLFDALCATERGSSVHAAAAVRRALRDVSRRPLKTTSCDVAAEAARLIEARYVRLLDVKWVALQVGCCETALRRLFRTKFGMSMRDYHTRLRIRQALRLMRAGRRSVVDLAWTVGYCSEKNFYRAVRDVTGTTPACLMNWSASALEALAAELIPDGRGRRGERRQGDRRLAEPGVCPAA